MSNPLTVQEILRKALLLVGAIGQGETPSNEEAQDALNMLIYMLDSWSTESSSIFTVQRYIFTLGTKQVYTCGPGGDWQLPYTPPKIEDAYVQITTTSPSSEIRCDVLNAQQWAEIPVKGASSPIPQAIWCDYQWPLSNISIYPIPQGGNNLILYMWQQLTTPSSLTMTMAFPPGYFYAIIYNLAVTLAPLYGATIGDDVKELATKGKANIDRKNSPLVYLQVDDALVIKNRTFNWQTGEPQ